MRTNHIGEATVSAIGLGGMPFSLEDRPTDEQGIATVHAALEAGITLIDTADAYSQGGDDTGHNERLIAQALKSWSGDPSEVLVATKGGHVRPGDGSWQVDGRPEYLRDACEASLGRLGVEAIGLYQFHRPDPDVPYAESIGMMKQLQDEGKVRMVGISNATVTQIDEARSIVDIVSVQNQFSPSYRSSEGELQRCAGLGIAFLPWSPLGGISSASKLGSRYDVFQEVADAHGVSPQQVCLAWMLGLASVVIPIPGSSRPETIRDSAAAADLDLSEDERARLSAA